MIELRQTDLPDPVAPAISRCGIEARSATTGEPETPEPRAIGSGDLPAVFANSRDSSTLRSVTTAELAFGTSMPTTERPGTGASMRSAGAASASARSFCSAVIGLRFTRTRVRETSICFVRGWPSSSRTVSPSGGAFLHGAGAHVPARLDAELGDGRTLVDLRNARLDAERGERLDDQLGAPLLVAQLRRERLRLGEQLDRRQLPAVARVTPGADVVLEVHLDLLRGQWLGDLRRRRGFARSLGSRGRAVRRRPVLEARRQAGPNLQLGAEVGVGVARCLGAAAARAVAANALGHAVTDRPCDVTPEPGPA